MADAEMIKVEWDQLAKDWCKRFAPNMTLYRQSI